MKTIAIPLAGSCLLLAGATAALPALAETIPIEEEFVVAQQLHVDASLDMLVMQLLGDGLIESGATLRYDGEYQILETAPGVYMGTHHGGLNGSYLGETWSTRYGAEMRTDALANKIWNLDSSGEWKKGPYAGKKFKDKGRLTEKPDNKADLELEIETEGIEETIKTTASNLDKQKGGGKLKVTGDITVTDDKGKKTTETLTIELDQEKKTFKSELKSPVGPFDVVVLKNTGSFTAARVGNAWHGTTAFDLTVTLVPEPTSPWLVLAGVGAMLGAQGLASRQRAARPAYYL